MSSYNLKAGAPLDTRYETFLRGIRLWQVYSQNGEEAIIQAIFDRIGTANQWCFECGAADGLFFSNTKLLTDRGWHALLVEAEPDDFSRLVALHQGNPKVQCLCALLSAGVGLTLDDVLTRAGAPKDLDLLVLDIDSQEYYLLNSLVEFRPRVVIVEYDPDAEPMYIPKLNGPGQAGHLAMRYVAEARGYEVICRTATNLVCVRRDLAKLLEEQPQPVPTDNKCKHGKAWHAKTSVPVPGCMCCGATRSVSLAGYCVDCLGEPQTKPRTGYGETPKPANTRQQVFAAGRWQDIDALEIEVLPEEEADAKAGRLPVRVLESEKRVVRIAAAMSMPSLTHTAMMTSVTDAIAATGMPLFTGHGCFWHHGLTRSIQYALNYRDKQDNPVDFILTIDFDSVFTVSAVKALVTLLAQHPEVDAIVPMQQKREGGELLAATLGSTNLTLPLVPITTGHFGLTLFRREAFDKLPKPWFIERASPSGDWGDGRRDPDIVFWDQFIAAGLQARLATQVLVGHKQEMVTWPVLQPNGQVVGVNQYGSQWVSTKCPPAEVTGKVA